MSIELLEHIEEENPELVNRVFKRRTQRHVAEAEDRVAGKPIDQQVAVLTELLDEQGYLADFETVSDTNYRINLHSCAIWAVANRYQQACTAELDLIRGLIPGATVERVTHKTDGAHTCVYEVTLLS